MSTESPLFYYCNDNVTVEGPRTWEQLLELYGKGIISSATAICQAGSDDWAPFGDFMLAGEQVLEDSLPVAEDLPEPSVASYPASAASVQGKTSRMTSKRWAVVTAGAVLVAILAYSGIRMLGINSKPTVSSEKPLATAAPDAPPPAPSSDPEIMRLQRDAKQGDVVAAYKLGIKYRDGVGVARNWEQALLYLQQAAVAGNVWGQIALAGMYAQSGSQDEAKHFCWIEKAAKNGDQHAMFVAALCHADGVGTPKNLQEAARWVIEAANNNPAKADEAATGADSWMCMLQNRGGGASSATDLLGDARKNRGADAFPKQANPEAKTAEMPTLPPTEPVPTPAASPSPAGKAQVSKPNVGQQPASEETPDFLPPTAPLAESGSFVPKQRILVTEVYGPSPGAASYRAHYKLARKLKEEGHEITVIGDPEREHRISVAGGPVQNLGTFRDIIGMTPDKWVVLNKVNVADYGVVLALAQTGAEDKWVNAARHLGKLIVISQDKGPWVFDRDTKAANAAEREYLKTQAEKGYLQKSAANALWRNAPWWDEKAAIDNIKNRSSLAGLTRLVATARDGVTSITSGRAFGEMRSCDVASWKNVVAYNLTCSLDALGGRTWGYVGDKRGYDGMRGYNDASIDKFVSQVLCPTVQRAIQTHKEIPEATSGPKFAKASHLPPRPSLPKSFPLERPKREGKVVCSGKGNPGMTVGEGQAKARAVPDNLRAVQIACSYLPTTCLALKPDGTVVAWGNDESICNVPAGLTDVVQVALGDGWPGDLAAALKADGTVVVWGKGAEKLQSDLSGIVQIVVGNGQIIGLKADGTLAAGHRSALATIKEPLVQISGGRNPLGLTSEGKVVSLKSRPDSDFFIPLELGEVASLADCHNSQAQQSAVILYQF